MTELVPPVILSKRHPGEAGGYSTRRAGNTSKSQPAAGETAPQ